MWKSIIFRVYDLFNMSSLYLIPNFCSRYHLVISMLRKTHDIPEDRAKWSQKLGSRTSLGIWVQDQKVMSVMTPTFISRFINVELGGTISKNEKAESLSLHASQSEDFWCYYLMCLTWGILWERIGAGLFLFLHITYFSNIWFLL